MALEAQRYAPAWQESLAGSVDGLWLLCEHIVPHVRWLLPPIASESTQHLGRLESTQGEQKVPHDDAHADGSGPAASCRDIPTFLAG